MKKFWHNLPITYKIFGLILLFLAMVEIIATIFVWKYESKVLLQKERQNLTKELENYHQRLLSHLSTLKKETLFLAKLEVMDDIVAKDIDQRILTLLERKANDLGEDIQLVIGDLNNTIIIAPKALLGKTIHSFSTQALLFKAPLFASFEPTKKLGNLYLLYPLHNLRNLPTQSPYKELWLKPPYPLDGFTTPKISEALIVSKRFSTLLPGWRLYLAYQKEEALQTIKEIEKVQLYTFLISTLLLAFIILTLSKRLTLPLIELLKNSEKALEAKSTFLSTISHELRTPLGSILNLTQHLTLSIKADEEAHKMLHAIETSAQHLLSMINNILQLSKLEAKSIVAKKEEVDLEEILEEIIEIIEPLVTEKEIVFQTKTKIKIKRVITDSNLLKQVFINLLSNAIKFTNKGAINVSLTQTHNTYIFQVQDTGIGIEKKRQKELFTPFFQAHTTPQNLTNGSGLGLSLSQKVATLLGGKITIQSEGINKGTTATFYFKSF